jgi:hypothetical protein
MEEMRMCPLTQRKCFNDGAPEICCAWSEDGDCIARQALNAITRLGDAASYFGEADATMCLSGDINTYEQN